MVSTLALPICPIRERRAGLFKSQVSSEGLQLEGASFDRAGNLLFVDVFGGTVFKLTPGKVLSTVLAANALGSAGIAIHRDGRIFVAGLGNFVDPGGAGRRRRADTHDSAGRRGQL